MSEFGYILEKIADASFEQTPFKHIEIRDLFSKPHFDQIVKAPEINVMAESGPKLIEALLGRGFKLVNMPNCVLDAEEYIEWHKRKEKNSGANRHGTCEGFGIVFRLVSPQTPILGELLSFMQSDDFNNCIASKFGIDLKDCSIDGGLQKYLDGYEISPHPDTQHKALTYMVNINNGPDSEMSNFHTHYLRFLPKWDYIPRFWDGNPEVLRCWVPWDWCKTNKQQTANNSIVIFSPASDTMHAVRADYDHLRVQRTQLYGNLWFNEVDLGRKPTWQQLVIRSDAAYEKQDPSVFQRIKGRFLRLGKSNTREEDGNKTSTNMPSY